MFDRFACAGRGRRCPSVLHVGSFHVRHVMLAKNDCSYDFRISKECVAPYASISRGVIPYVGDFTCGLLFNPPCFDITSKSIWCVLGRPGHATCEHTEHDCLVRAVHCQSNAAQYTGTTTETTATWKSAEVACPRTPWPQGARPQARFTRTAFLRSPTEKTNAEKSRGRKTIA